MLLEQCQVHCRHVANAQHSYHDDGNAVNCFPFFNFLFYFTFLNFASELERNYPFL